MNAIPYFAEPELAERIRAELPNADVRQHLADSHRLQAASDMKKAESYRLKSASMSALARYERASGNRHFATSEDFNGYIAHLEEQAKGYEEKAAKIEHEIATGAK